MHKAIIKSILKVPPIGRVASHCTHRWAAAPVHERVAAASGYTPATIAFNVRSRTGARRLRMLYTGERGLRDQVARRVWTGGWQAFEAPLPALWFAACAESGGVALDVGANSGLYSLLAAAAGARRVHAFEPLPSAMSFLKANISASGLEKTIVAEPLAVGDGPGAATLYIPKQPPGFDLLESSASLNAGFRESHDEAIEVEVVSLDSYISSRGVENVKTVKIDVESYERTVLAGMQTILETHRPLVFLEVLNDDVADAVREVCARHDYAAYAMDHDRLTRSAFESSMTDRNMALCPVEREDSLRSLAAGVGLLAERDGVPSRG